MTLAQHRSAELMLVPSERHAEHEAARGGRALTLRELAARLAKSAAPALRAVPSETTRLLTHRILRGQRFAMALAVDDALGQLRRAGASEDDLRNCAGQRALLLANTLREADQKLAELGLRDERANTWLAARALGTPSIRELAGVSTIVVRGFSHWDNGDLELFEALHHALREKAGAGVVLELPQPHDALGPLLRDAVSDLSARLERRWASHNEHPELEFVAARAFASPPAVVRAAHEASEARAVARAVLDALAQGAALDRIAILPVDAAEAFLEPLRAELEAAQLPVSEPWGRRADSAPEAHAALALMRLAVGPLERDALVDVLRLPDLRLGWLSDRDLYRIPFVGVLARLPIRVDRSGRELLEALGLRRRLTEPDDERALEALGAAEEVLSGLLARFGHLRSEGTRLSFKRRWGELFAELGLLAASAAALSRAIASAERGDRAPLAALGQNASAGRTIDLALERVIEAAEWLGLANEVLRLPDFLEEFAAALASVQPGLGASRAGALRILRPADAAGLDWDLLVVCRAASSSLDWQSSSADGILERDMIEGLPAQSRPLTTTDRALFTRLALASSLSRARRVVLTWAKRDARGGSGASRLVLALGASSTRDEPASPLDPEARRVVTRAPPSVELRARAAKELNRQAFYSDPESPLDWQNGLAGPLDDLVGGDALRPIALTHLERYARCGFLGFSNTVLRAGRDDAIGDGLSARERGTLIHEALAQALAGTRALFGSTDRAELERLALSRAKAFLEAQSGSNLRRAALSAALQDVSALLRWSFANSDGVWFAEAERAFGVGSEWPALALGEHFVSGRIDRIDANSDRSVLRIIDYKTGSVRLRGEHGEQLLQPWLYAKKVAEEYRARRVSSGYLSLRRRKPEWNVALEESEPEVEPIAQKLARAEELLLALRSGRVPARPYAPSACTRCDARDICRRPLSAPHETAE